MLKLFKNSNTLGLFNTQRHLTLLRPFSNNRKRGGDTAVTEDFGFKIPNFNSTENEQSGSIPSFSEE
jgi:hypothetical protein